MRLLLCFFMPFLGWILENVIFIFSVRYYIRKKDIFFERRDHVVLGMIMFFLGIIFLIYCFFVDNTGSLEIMDKINSPDIDIMKERVFAALFYEEIFLLLTLVGWIDQKKKIIPNELNVCFFLLGILGAAIGQPEELALWERFAGAGCISIPVMLINRIYPGAFGNGDVKFLSCVGFVLGWELLFQGTLAGSFLAAAGVIVLLLTHRIGRKDSIAFGPYLCAGIAIHLFLSISIL